MILLRARCVANNLGTIIWLTRGRVNIRQTLRDTCFKSVAGTRQKADSRLEAAITHSHGPGRDAAHNRIRAMV